MAGVPEDEIKVDVTLGHVGRHCILHALTVIEAAISQVGSHLLDEFVKDLTVLVKVTPMTNSERKRKSSSFKSLPPIPIITSFEANKFYENVLSVSDFTKLLEERLKTTALESSIDLDVDKVQEVCWKYYSKEKKKALDYPDWLSPTCTYRLFLIFNQLLNEEMTLTITGQKLCFFLEKVATSCGFLGPVVSQVVKKDRQFGVSFPEFLEEITNCFDYLKLETCLTCEMILDFLDELVNGVLKKGYLVKEGHVRHNWKKRYFILQENIMSYYVSRENMKLKGKLVLNKSTKVFPIADEKGKPLYRFLVTCGATGKEFTISAVDQRNKSEWVCAIKEAVAIGRLKSTSGDEDDDSNNKDDMSEMAAHYKVKYGLQGLEKTLTLASKRFSRNFDDEEVSSSLDKKLTGSLPNLVDSPDESKDNDDDNGDDIPYMVMHPHAKDIPHSLSLSRLKQEAKPSHKLLSSSLSSAGAFTYSDSSSSDQGSIRVANSHLTSATRLGNYINQTTTIPENTSDELNEEEDEDGDHEEYYVFGPKSPVTNKRMSLAVINDKISNSDDDDDDDDDSHEYLKLMPLTNNNSTNQK